MSARKSDDRWAEDHVLRNHEDREPPRGTKGKSVIPVDPLEAEPPRESPHEKAVKRHALTRKQRAHAAHRRRKRRG